MPLRFYGRTNANLIWPTASHSAYAGVRTYSGPVSPSVHDLNGGRNQTLRLVPSLPAHTVRNATVGGIRHARKSCEFAVA
jgi:hypothetical protein